jgi:hypothetical protein
MPPKTKKVTEKVKAKVIEDKTFGLKNKKGNKQQKFIQTVQKQVNTGNPRDLLNDPNIERQKKKEEEKRKKEELASLFKPVAQTVPKGVDPKSILCSYFKQGICQKGDRCKFSHDLNVERKAEKRNVYEDARDTQDNMEDWDEQKLDDVINKRHGEDNAKKRTTTTIVCKYFIDAVENKTYGWFWTCPNGKTCMYRHALPPGFVLKSDAKKAADSKEEISMEALVEKERASLGSKVTKVTLESFLAWKKRKVQEKKKDAAKQDAKKVKDFKSGFHNGLSGRDLFTFNPNMVADDDEDGDTFDYTAREGNDDEAEGDESVKAKEVDLEYFANLAREADTTGSVATGDRFAYMKNNGGAEQEQVDDEQEEGKGVDAAEKKDSLIDNDTVQSKDKDATKKTKTKKKLDIDESLFNVDDLAEIQDELQDLDVNQE